VIRSLFGNRKEEFPRNSLPLAPGRVIYAVGDIHGRSDLLKKILAKIRNDIEVHSSASPMIVFLGDYVDRGDDSAEVLSIIERMWLDRSGCEHVFIKGNHEAAMLDFLDSPETNGGWLRFGGLQTLHSFGLRGINEHSGSAALNEAAHQLRQKLASQEMLLRAGLRLSVRVGNIFFCHAAVDVTRRLDDQPEAVLLWGKPGFTTGRAINDAWVVHGHTITAEPDIGHNRIGIDTGAYYSGRLTAARISDGNLRFLST
jgi:serine/threonine protein phosphatase 1